MERWQPYREALSLRDAMDRLFQDSWVNTNSGARQGQPNMVGVSVDVHETENGYELCASLPGWKPEDINITVHGDTVTLSGQHKTEERKDEGRQYHLRERRFGSFARSFSFPGPIDAGNAQARYENGELTLTIPKAEQARPRRIQIAGAPAGANRQPTATPEHADKRQMTDTSSAGQRERGGTEVPIEGSSRTSRSRSRQSGP